MNRWGRKEHHPEADGLTVVEREAAAWVLRREQGLAGSEVAEFDDWLHRDPQNERVFSEMAETSRLLDRLGECGPSGADAAAAAFAGRRLVPYARAALLFAAVAVFAAVGWLHWSTAATPYAATASTEVGGLRKMLLSDGSVVTLNTNTAVKISYSADVRRAELLRGEAYFSVVHNAARPFLVRAGGVTVRDVGTAFNVRMTTNAVDVLVTEGEVRVIPADQDAAGATPSAEPGSRLTPGHLAQVPLAAGRGSSAHPIVINSVELRAVRSTLAWTEGRLEFFDAPLADVVSEFNRYNREKIVIADPELAARRFGGAFASHETSTLLELLQQSFGVVSERRGDVTTISLAR